ncbi:GH11775 [Drosophila grimshawi]|uniref:GH11775 n=1 Tax=Drosophila grimshawi TaxID=7222 RepID=B4K267_DROGR|nr:GH11775 [Drosophila grimshawi]
MAQVQVVALDTRCRCRQDFIGATFGWLWGPCRQCRQRQIIVLPAANGTTQYVTVPQQVVRGVPQQVQYVTPAKTANNCHQKQALQQQPQYPSTAPPEYSEKAPVY